MSGVDVLGRPGPDGPSLFVLYTGGTFGMAPGGDGSLVPLDLRELGVHVPAIRQLPLALTVATFPDPIFVVVERRVAVPMLDLALLRNRSLVGSTIAILIGAGAPSMR